MPTISDQAVVIRHWEFSETSQTVSLFAREHGIIRGLAKGARRDKAPYSGGFEVLTSGNIVAIIKSGRDLATLTEWDLSEVFWATRRDLLSHHIGLYMADLVHWGLQPQDPHPGLFDALVRALRALEEEGRREQALLGFQWEFLVETGYKPHLLGDTPREDGAEVLGFSPSRGRVVRDPGPEAPPSIWRVRAETIDLLQELESRGAERVPAISSDDRAASRRACRLLVEYVRFVLERDLPTRSGLLEALAAIDEGGVKSEGQVADK